MLLSIVAASPRFPFSTVAPEATRLRMSIARSGDWPAPSPAPTGVAVFAGDIAIRRYGEQANNIVHWSDFHSGGHFAALETPGLLVQDIRAFFASLTS